MTRRLIWLLLIGALLSLAIIVAESRPTSIGDLLYRDLMSTPVQIAAAFFIGGIALALFRRRLSQVLEVGAAIAVIGLVLAAGYSYRDELQQAGGRVLAVVLPAQASTQFRNVEVSRGKAGDFPVMTRINGARVPMTLDTGATSVVLTHEAAKRAGLPLEVLNYSVPVETANGQTRAAPVTIERIAIGGLTETSVPALVAQPGQLKSNLLGMTFLNRLESWEVRGDRVVLRGYP